MRRDRAFQSRGIFSGSEWTRLLSMIGLLVVVGMFMFRLRDPDVARVLGTFLNEGQTAETVGEAQTGATVGCAESGEAHAELAQADASTVRRGSPDPADSRPKVSPAGASGRPAVATVVRSGDRTTTEGAAPACASQDSAHPTKTANPEKPAPAPQAEKPEPSGPTDEDPEEAESIRDEFQAVDDRTLTIRPEEMVPYNRVVGWVYNQSAAQMRKRARRDLEYHDFITSAAKHRGELVEFMLDARLIRKCPEPPKYPTPLHEIWGPTPQSGTWLFETIVVDLPEGLPVGTNLSEQVRFVGYFFKLQSYHPKAAGPNDRPLVAPVFIGRAIWVQSPGAEARKGGVGQLLDRIPSWAWAIGIVATGTVIVGAVWFAGWGRRSLIRELTRPSSPGAVPVEQWFDQAEADEGLSLPGHRLDQEGNRDEN